MDVRFLKDISEAYIMDSGLQVEPEQIFEELYNIAKFLQTYDNDLYNELYESTKLQQQQILKRYLDISYEQHLISETGIIIPADTILVGIVSLIFGKSIAKTLFKAGAVLGGAFETLGKWLSRHGKYSQIRYAIIQQNTQACYSKCGIKTPADIKVFSYISIKSGSALLGINAIQQGICLRECYITELSDLIALHMENYFVCLKKTGGFEVVQKSDSDDIIKMISNTNIASACESYYNAAREALDNFYRVIEMVYNSQTEADKRLEKINQLRTKIYEAKQLVQKINQNQIQRYDSTPVKSYQNQPHPRPHQQQHRPN